MTSAASNFMDFIQWLDKKKIPYFIAWGYEHLPEQPSGGDVDIYVHPSAYFIVREELIRRGYSSAKCPAFSLDHWHEQFGCVDCHTIHLFSSFCFNFMGKRVLLNIHPDHLLRGKIKLDKLWIPDPVVEMLFTALRVIGGRKDCMKRLKKYLEVSKYAP